MSGFMVSGDSGNWYFDAYEEALLFVEEFEDEYFKTVFSIEEFND